MDSWYFHSFLKEKDMIAFKCVFACVSVGGLDLYLKAPLFGYFPLLLQVIPRHDQSRAKLSKMTHAFCSSRASCLTAKTIGSGESQTQTHLTHNAPTGKVGGGVARTSIFNPGTSNRILGFL